MLQKEYIVIVRDPQGDLIQIFSNDAPATEEDIERCLIDAKGHTAFVDVVYRIKE